MAARMRSGGSGAAYIVAVTLFGILFLFSAMLAIIYMAQVEKARIEATEAKQSLAIVIKSNEFSRADITEMRRNGGSSGSVVGQLLTEINDLKGLIVSTEDATVDTILAQMNSAGVDTENGQTLINALNMLRAEHESTIDLVSKYKNELEALQKRIPEIEKRVAVQASTYDEAVDMLGLELAALQSGFEDFQAQVDGQRSTLKEQLDTVRTRMHTTVTELRGSVDQKDQQLAVQKSRLEDLKRHLTKAGAGGGADITRQPDGTVTAIVSEENLVYIDRGSVDHVQLGMAFEVFSPATGVLVDEFGELRGKATIEVIETDDTSSLARVVRRSRGPGVDEGDLIANLVYDPDAVFTFYVSGVFDLDTTGKPTATDRRRVEAMVRQWGGLIAEQLTYSTDFLVLGQEPKLPDPLPRDVIDPKLIEQHAAQMRQFKKYQELVGEAKALSIPILNQNRFLALVGYYQR